jgi:hypothetical protein
MAFIQHPDQDIRQALVQLTDALCSWERDTGIKSVLILREPGGFVYRAVNGKHNVPDDVEDAQLMKIVEGK